MFRSIIAASTKVRAVLVNGDEWLTTERAGELAGRHPETVRTWVRANGDLGYYDGIARRYLVSRRALVKYVTEHHGGVLPHGLVNSKVG